MADFLPNLDDAELHLPSDIYPRQSPTIFSSSRATETPEFPSELTYMQDLAEQLAELALNDRILSQQDPKPPPNAPQVPFSASSSYFCFWVFFSLLSFPLLNRE